MSGPRRLVLLCAAALAFAPRPVRAGEVPPASDPRWRNCSAHDFAYQTNLPGTRWSTARLPRGGSLILWRDSRSALNRVAIHHFELEDRRGHRIPTRSWAYPAESGQSPSASRTYRISADGPVRLGVPYRLLAVTAQGEEYAAHPERAPSQRSLRFVQRWGFARIRPAVLHSVAWIDATADAGACPSTTVRGFELNLDYRTRPGDTTTAFGLWVQDPPSGAKVDAVPTREPDFVVPGEDARVAVGTSGHETFMGTRFSELSCTAGWVTLRQYHPNGRFGPPLRLRAARC